MAIVDMDSIYKKCQNFSKTTRGKKLIRESIAEMRKSGKVQTGCGDSVLTHKIMAQLAKELIDTIKTTAASYDLAESVMAHFDSLTYVVQDLGNGTYECDIYFQDDLSRESLDTGDYADDEGINNIIALFNNGYVASSPKYGWWHNHRPTGDAVLRSTNNSAWIISRQARPSLQFMQRAINDFSGKYSAKYNLNVILNDDEYDGNYAGSLNGIIKKIQ